MNWGSKQLTSAYLSSPAKSSFSFVFGLSILPLSIWLSLLVKPHFPFFFRLGVSPLSSSVHSSHIECPTNQPFCLCHSAMPTCMDYGTTTILQYQEINSQLQLNWNIWNMDIHTYGTTKELAAVQHTSVGLTPNYLQGPVPSVVTQLFSQLVLHEHSWLRTQLVK